MDKVPRRCSPARHYERADNLLYQKRQKNNLGNVSARGKKAYGEELSRSREDKQRHKKRPYGIVTRVAEHNSEGESQRNISEKYGQRVFKGLSQNINQLVHSVAELLIS